MCIRDSGSTSGRFLWRFGSFGCLRWTRSRNAIAAVNGVRLEELLLGLAKCFTGTGCVLETGKGSETLIIDLDC